MANNEPDPDSEVVTLPPFVISALRIDRNPWRYAKVDDFEILTRASDLDTSEVIQALQFGEALESRFIPPEWRAAPSLPYTVIVDDADLRMVANSHARTSPMQFERPVDAITWHDYAEKARVISESNGAGDRDTYAVNCNIFGHGFRQISGTITLEKLARTTPPLPVWLMAGLIGRTSGVFRASFSRVESEDRVVGPGLLWISPEETARLLKQIAKDRKANHPTVVPMLPLGELFVEAPPAPNKLALWESEAALLVHWALFGPGREGQGRAALVAFVERARLAPVSEPMFVRCFGMTYRQMHRELEAYLVHQLPSTTRIDEGLHVPIASLDFQSATSGQIGRILGDWLRMRAAHLQEGDPVLSRQLLQAAHRVLERAYREDNGLPPDVNPTRPGTERILPPAGSEPVVTLTPMVITADRIRDPLLLAVHGLHEHQMGAYGQARELLEKAAKVHAPRPEALRILAALRYDEARAQPGGAEGKLSLSQATSVLQPLRIRLKQNSGSNAYLLFIEVWEQCDAHPSRDDIDVVSEAVRRYPRNALLVHRAALLCARAGYATEARVCIDQGLLFASAQTRAALERLRDALADR